MRRPVAALAHQSCAQVRADALADIARLIYQQDSAGPGVDPALEALARSPALAAALASGDDARAARIVRTMVAAGRFVRLRVVTGSHVVADVGVSAPLVAPVRQALIDARGSVVGQALFSIQSAKGYADFASYLTHAQVLVRAGATQLAGAFAGPVRLPVSGPITYRGSLRGRLVPGRAVPEWAADCLRTRLRLSLVGVSAGPAHPHLAATVIAAAESGKISMRARLPGRRARLARVRRCAASGRADQRSSLVHPRVGCEVPGR
jgi:hypothetical protein